MRRSFPPRGPAECKALRSTAGDGSGEGWIERHARGGGSHPGVSSSTVCQLADKRTLSTGPRSPWGGKGCQRTRRRPILAARSGTRRDRNTVVQGGSPGPGAAFGDEHVSRGHELIGGDKALLFELVRRSGTRHRVLQAVVMVKRRHSKDMKHSAFLTTYAAWSRGPAPIRGSAPLLK